MIGGNESGYAGYSPQGWPRDFPLSGLQSQIRKRRSLIAGKGSERLVGAIDAADAEEPG